jgi:prevent-host-death family protein
MRDTYSLYETKAKLSAIIRRVREGHRVVVTVHGEPVAEIRPIEAAHGGLEHRLEELAERGVLVRPAESSSGLRAVVRRPGALARFLADRDG